jgi:hexosaminidase
MKELTILLIIVTIFGCNSNINNRDEQKLVNIIPEPVSITVHKGNFLLNRKTKIFAIDEEALPIAKMAAKEISYSLGNELQVRQENVKNSQNSIIFKIDTTSKIKEDTGDEVYKIQVTPKQVLIIANKPQGLFYGFQSLHQLIVYESILCEDIPNSIDYKHRELSIPCVEILDYPRFEWRGLMLDVSRHFFSKEFLKKYIDEMVKYKFNIFHLHLTDDQGWRIQTESLPKLTEVGAWRVPRTGKWWSFSPPQPGEKATYGGFYTPDDIKEIVQYAQERFVTIIPEIDIPGHSLAAIAAYPDLSCTKEKYKVNPGSRFYGIDNNTLCAGQEATFDFLEKVLTEIADLFPSRYIHIGGDECFKGFWEKCDSCKRRMDENNLADTRELQSYFIRRTEQILKKKGKKLVGWDEILEGGLAPDATVMSWRGTQGGTKAAKMGHHVIMTPNHHTYLDLYQGDPLVEPETYSSLRLEDCYNFEPVPPNVGNEYILGGQGNLWTESVPNYRHAEYMTWPRALALSEVFWSPQEKRDWDDFIRRMEFAFEYMDKNEINYSRSSFDPIISAIKTKSDSIRVKIRTEISGLDIHYSFDETNPDIYSPKYEGIPLEIPTGASQIKVRTFRSGQPVGKQINCPVSVLNERIEKEF